MEHRQLRYAIAVADAQSFSKAASMVHVAQSAVSYQIARLEEEVGFAIFERSHRSIKVTEAGLEFVARARGIVRQIDALTSGKIGLPNEPAGELAVGVPGSLQTALASPAIARFRERFPKVLLKIEQGTTSQLRDALFNHRLDIALVSDVEKLPGLNSYPLVREQLYLVGPRESDLRENVPVRAASLAKYPQIATPPQNSLRHILDRSVSRSCRKPTIVAEVTGTEMILDLIELGVGFSVLPSCAFCSRLAAHRVRVAPLDKHFIGWVIAEVRDAPNAVAASLLRDELFRAATERIGSKAWPGAIRE